LKEYLSTTKQILSIKPLAATNWHIPVFMFAPCIKSIKNTIYYSNGCTLF